MKPGFCRFLLVLGVFVGWTSAFAGEARSKWPYHPWTQAKAYTFNFLKAGPGYQTVVYRDGKWSEQIRSIQDITPEQAAEVLRIVETTQGSYESSKCPFPRHSIVFFDAQNQPVGTVDVCFECEDLFVWPEYPISDEAKYRNKKIVAALPKALKAYAALFTELGQPLDWSGVPPVTPLPTPQP